MAAAPTKPEAASAGQQRAEPQAEIVLGVIVAPGLARDVTAKIASELADDLRALDTGVDWRTELAVDRLVAPPAQTADIVDAARRKLLEANWDLGVVVTDRNLLGLSPFTGGFFTTDFHVREKLERVSLAPNLATVTTNRRYLVFRADTKIWVERKRTLKG